VNIEFLSTVAVIAPDPSASRELFVDALGLPSKAAARAITTPNRSRVASPSASGRSPRPLKRASAPLSGRRSVPCRSSASNSTSGTPRRRSCSPGARASRIRTAASAPRRTVGSDGRQAAIAGRGDRRHLVHPDVPRRQLIACNQCAHKSVPADPVGPRDPPQLFERCAEAVQRIRLGATDYRPRLRPSPPVRRRAASE
jgi:hypothetical protein